jgi:hypothetical protein
MNDLLLDKLRVLSRDRVTLEALKQVFIDAIESQKPDIDIIIDDKIVGQKYRAYKIAEKIINKTIMDIESHNELKVDKQNYNKGK